MHQRLQKSYFRFAANFAAKLLLGALIATAWELKVQDKLGGFKG
jgi:hypothetical protein